MEKHPWAFRTLLFSTCLFIFSFGSANALPPIEISYPEDNSVVFSNIISVKGKAVGAKALKLNGKPVKPASNGRFSANVFLKNGKNLLIIESLDDKGRNNSLRIRILKKVFYPDNNVGWAKGVIQNLATLNLIEGYPDNNFYPNYPITRGEFATWLARVNDLQMAKLTSDPFADVPKEHWRAPYIAAVNKKGYMGAISDQLMGVFGIDEPIKRSEVAEIALKAEGVKIIPELSGMFFRDVPASKDFQTAVNTAKKEGLVLGVSKKVPLFDPNRYLSRAEAGMLLSRFTKAQEKLNDLNNFNRGYSEKVLSKVDIPPIISKFTISPPSVFVNRVQIIKLRASIASRQGFYPISKVVVDLSNIGGDADVEMYDDGTYGDEKARDGQYSLNINLSVAEDGEKIITVKAIDTLGLEGKRSASLWVVK